MSNRNLSEIARDLDEQEKIAGIDLQEIPSSVRGGWTMKVGDAKTRAGELRAEYRQKLLATSVAILVEGPDDKVEELLALAKSEGGISVDVQGMYKSIAQQIEPSVSEQRRWGVHQSYLLTLALQGIMADLNLREIPAPRRTEEFVVPDSKATVARVRQLIRESEAADTLNRLWIEADAERAARATKYAGNGPAILVYGAQTPEEALDVTVNFGRGREKIAVGADDVVDRDYLVKALREANKRIKALREANKRIKARK